MSAADLCNRRLAGTMDDPELEIIRLKAALIRIATMRWRKETPEQRVLDLQDLAAQALDEHLERLNGEKPCPRR